jgi:hypothetical protein
MVPAGARSITWQVIVGAGPGGDAGGVSINEAIFMKSFYLMAAIVGAVIPLALFAEHFAAAGFDAGTFMRAVFANPAASGFVADVLISSVVF